MEQKKSHCQTTAGKGHFFGWWLMFIMKLKQKRATRGLIETTNPTKPNKEVTTIATL